MDYFRAFIIGGLICALVQILLDENQTSPRQSHGSSGMFRCPAKRSWYLSSLSVNLQVPELPFLF